MYAFLKDIVIGQKNRYLVIIGVLSILFCFDFTLLIILTNISLINDSLFELIGQIIILITMIVSFILMMFINNFFVDQKSDEFSIILLSGRNVVWVSKYITVQFGSLFILAALFGSSLSVLFVKGISSIFSMFKILELFSIHSISTIFYYYISLLLVKICFIFIVDLGKFMDIKFRIVEYMNHIQKHKTKVSFFSSFIVEKEKKSIPIWQIVIVLLSLFIIVTSIQHIIVINDFVSLLVYFTSSLIALIFFVKYFIPLFFDFFHNKWLIEHPMILMAINQLIYLLKAMTPLILINTILTPFMFFLISMPIINIYLLGVVIICYLILLFMIAICFVFRFSVYIPVKTRDIATLKLIGYSKKEIDFIHELEIILFVFFAVVLPFLIYITVVSKAYILDFISIKLIISLISCYFIIYLFIGLYMIIGYKRLTREVIKNVKYLNRSE